jgi:uncharacterized cupin superfamily protein
MADSITPFAVFDGLRADPALAIHSSVPGKGVGHAGFECSQTVVAQSPDSRVSTGVWTCEPCDWARMEMGERAEFFHILEGAMILHEDGKEPIEAGPGSSVFSPPGWKGSWRVPQRLVKTFVSFYPVN